MNRKQLFGAAAITALLLGIPGARADVVIGVALPRTGSVASIGDQINNGVTAAAKAINDKGGVMGQKLVLDIQDDACDPKQAVSVANRFMQGTTRMVVGHVCSGASIVASEVYAENGAIMMTPASNSARLTDRGLAGIFRVCGRDDHQGQLSAKLIAERFAGKKVAILHDNTPFSRGLADSTKANLNKAGVTEALFNSITPGERDYTAVVTRLKAANIDLVYYGGYHQEMGTLVRQSAEQAFKAQWFGTSGIASKEFSAIAGPASDGVLMTFNPDPRKREEAAAVVGAFKAQNIDPEGFTLYGYAAVQALAQAVEKAKSADPKAVEKTLKAERFDTVLGQVGFDPKGDITAPGYVLYVWKGGNFDYAN
ncbi:MAG: High-affinity leucine-specific transport system, periplasmic binding protein LivK [uncultured Microvirga sp.]|uniref:High-affinity leucine-specific transport system, periplasmic binding protein LivK n=1 Tax=uncultured Microvirga sp. TaxID=412392 RepID=A0A6J4L996_9HYPH|nr:MAG: High-affinity leucine-specific transport system, periplasmic binding protein LivK [uncultured Microvirga sp.]